MVRGWLRHWGVTNAPHVARPAAHGKVSDAPFFVSHRHHALLERLAQRVEHRGRELPQLVEEQHAAMPERHKMLHETRM